MVGLSIVLDGTVEPSGPAFDPSTAIHVTKDVKVVGMPRGTNEGRATVFIRASLPGGGEVWIETTLRLFLVAADALRARYPDDGR